LNALHGPSRYKARLSEPAVMTLLASKRRNRSVTNREDRSLKSPLAREADNEISKSFQLGSLRGSGAGVVLDTPGTRGESRDQEAAQHPDYRHGRSASERHPWRDAEDHEDFP
jgi:hypothetical protein